MTEKIEVFLTTQQKNKFESGKTFQLSSHQLQAGTGKHHVEIEMTSKNHKELLRNVAKNKGYRFSSSKIIGGSIFGKVLKSVAKSVAPTALDYIGKTTGTSKVMNTLKPSADGLTDLGVDRITGGKINKGSPEMAERMARLRSMRKGKGSIDGGNIAQDMKNFGNKIKNGFNKTFNPKLGREMKFALTSPIAKNVYKGIADVGIDAVGAYTGNPILGMVESQLANGAIDGLGVECYAKKNTMMVGGSLINGVPNVQIRSGKGFTGVNATRFGSSFRSAGLIQGSSMISP